ncbi:cobalt-precorrin 5A hydrolase [Natroniella sp. ANB-PHB2]|uniref:cobalt-precorrin 5A hydrolase n=1 Tax=Natroniella sp. ANB-PHB2 TaxID=3384444 RepID=UPI0038D4EEC6
MKLAIVALTEEGKKLASKLEQDLEADIYLPAKLSATGVIKFDSSLKELVGQLFKEYDGIICIMALGIVVRVLARYVADKRKDPAVITIDETGQHVISTLSGHLGGANCLTERIAELIEAEPVITTATDCQGKLAFDLLAKELGCEVIPFSNLKLANGALVNEKRVNIFTDLKLDLELDQNVRLFPLEKIGTVEGFPVIISERKFTIKEPYLQLVPQNIVVGLGCRRGVSKKQVRDAVELALTKLELKIESIKKLATVDLKQDEAGILEYAEELEVPVEIISRVEIMEADFEYTTSEFVRKQIGVGGVCEPVAIISANKRGELILSKTVSNQVTVAVVKEVSML